MDETLGLTSSLPVNGMLSANLTEFLQLEAVGPTSLFTRAVIPTLAIGTFECDVFSQVRT